MDQTLVLPYFDGVEVPLVEAPSNPVEAAALQAFLTLTPAERLAASRHVHAYYLDFHSAVGGEDWLDAEMGIPATAEAIWNHVRPKVVFAAHDPYSTTGDAYVVVEADCDWEEEHGLMLCFRHGTRLTKCGGFDGHLTNASAYDDDTLADIVYHASNPGFTTRSGG